MSYTHSHRGRSYTLQSIPLQNLSRPTNGDDECVPQLHRRTLSDCGQDSLGQTSFVSTGRHGHSQYSLSAKASHISTHNPKDVQEEGASSMKDVGMLQATVELDMDMRSQNDTSTLSSPLFAMYDSLAPDSSKQPYKQCDGEPYTHCGASGERRHFSSTHNDKARLNDTRDLELTSGTATSMSPHQQDRSSFLSPGDASSASQKCDEVGNVEAVAAELGTSRGRKQYLMPGRIQSPLRHAATIVCNMSTRVANISNDPEVIERTLRQKPSGHQNHLQETPYLPVLPGYLVESSESAPRNPSGEPTVTTVCPSRQSTHWQRLQKPLRGRSLGIFSAESKLRIKLCDLLVHPATEPLLLVLIIIQTILLAIDASETAPYRRGHAWDMFPLSPIDWALFGLFIIYTIEAIIRIVVSGLVMDPVEHSTMDRPIAFTDALDMSPTKSLRGPQRPSVQNRDHKDGDKVLRSQQPSVLQTSTMAQMPPEINPGNSCGHRSARLAHRAYLRHSFNRMDFIAVVSYWIAFTLGIISVNNGAVVQLFRMLSCLRIVRLLNLTNGSSVILRSLKKAAPSLMKVAFLIGFFWLLFAIVGVQSFKSSFRRRCTWIDPEGQNNFTNMDQFCGGHLLNVPEYIEQGYIAAPGMPPGPAGGKGFFCPKGSLCIEGHNPFNDTRSFDNILQSLELVFVIMSSNGWSDLLYIVADTDYLVSALYFVAGLLVLTLWLVSLLIAVITASFQIIREESETSAFTGEDIAGDNTMRERAIQRVSSLKQLYARTTWIWIVVISYGLVCQTMRSASMSDFRRSFIDVSETVVTLILLVEILIRITSDWRHFFSNNRNIVDMAIAIVTTIIQLPALRNAYGGRAYAWLTIFQIIRVYRVVLAVPILRDPVVTVFGNTDGLLNLVFFVFLLTFLASIFASQLFRGVLPKEVDGEVIQVSFSNLYDSFLGMYQILSSEDWIGILSNVTSYQKSLGTAWIGAAFCILWFVFANLIVLNMFIAVVQENLDVSEDKKRLQQVKVFLQRRESELDASHGNLSLFSVFKRGSPGSKDSLNHDFEDSEMLLKDAVVRDFLDESNADATLYREESQTNYPRLMPSTILDSRSLFAVWQQLLRKFTRQEPNPFYAPSSYCGVYENLNPRRMAEEVTSATLERRKAQTEYLRRHPDYNMSLFIFRPNHPLRKICQRIVGPSRGGDRIEGLAPSPLVWYTFSALIYAAIITMVLLACITTPLYQREYFQTHGFSVKNWFVWTELGFAVLFTVEALIKVIADGSFWTPNAYFRGFWGLIDGVVLITLWVSVTTSLRNEGQTTRTVSAFKALRALRLLNVSDTTRNHFHALIVKGWWKLISAALVSLSLLIPFAIYGLNLFVGQLQSCNDVSSNIFNLADCIGEYASSPFDWDVLAPRQAANPYYDFDNFGNSLFVLFQTVSQEGWVDVMWSGVSITGASTQPEDFASKGNAVFFVAFNLLGANLVWTLLVSTFMRNYAEQTGVAFLTKDQRSWLELRKSLQQISPSKHPSSTKNSNSLKGWCCHQAIHRGGRWQKFITMVLMLHLLLLCLEWYPGYGPWEIVRDYIFLLITILLILNIIIRIIGLGWQRFRKSMWDVFSIFAITGCFMASIPVILKPDQLIFGQLHKGTLVSVALLFIPRIDQLNQLLQTAAASLAAITSLLATWFVLFLVYAIALTQAFGLTRFGENANNNINFRTVPKALVLLFRMSNGEGWNELMEGFATVKEPYCTEGDTYLESDCGSPGWARALFISWNILSMYIFVSLFVSLICESFSYVHQQNSELSVISREEVRRFKQAWAEFDPDGTGYISKEQFPRLLGKLSGVLKMSIYDGGFTVGRLIEECSSTTRTASKLPVSGPEPTPDLDIQKLNARLTKLPVAEVRRRRKRMDTFYEEVLMSSDSDKGIQFTPLLVTIVHYKVIDEEKSLRLEEFLSRRARLQRVNEVVHRNVVVGFFDTLYWARRFRNAMEQKRQGRLAAAPTFTIPKIHVDDEDIADTQRRRSPRTVGGTLLPPVELYAPDGSLGGITAGRPPTLLDLKINLGGRGRANSVLKTPRGSSKRATPRSPSSSAGSGDWQFASGLSRPPSPHNEQFDPLKAGGSYSRAGSAASAENIFEVLDDSAWGESIRRSFTRRRCS